MASDVVTLTVPLTNATATTPGVDATDSAPFDLPPYDCATGGNVTRGHGKPPGKKDGPSSGQPSPALVALLLGAAMVSNDEERAAAVDASVAAATDDTLRGVMDDLTPPGPGGQTATVQGSQRPQFKAEPGSLRTRRRRERSPYF